MKRIACLGLFVAVAAAGFLRAQQSDDDPNSPYYELGGFH